MQILLSLLGGLLLGFIAGAVIIKQLQAGKMTQRELELQAHLTSQFTTQTQELQIQLATALQARQSLEQQVALLQEKELLLGETQSNLARLTGEYQLLRTETEQWKTDLKQRWDAEYKAFLLEHLGQAQTQFSEKATKEQQEKQKLLNESIENLLKPMSEKLVNLEKETVGLRQTSKDLKDSTSRLTMTLSDNKRRGNWGEAQLEGLLEASGLQKGIHYFTQERVGISTKTPDIRVQLPDNRHILIDAKALHIEMDELTMTEEQLLDPNYQEKSQSKMAQALENAVKNLSQKNYAGEMDNVASFVVLFVPKESMLASAMIAAPSLFERAYRSNIILAGPYNLMGLLKLVNQGWRMDKLSQQADEILKLGQELYKQAVTFSDNYNDVGKHLERLTDAYRKTTTSFNGKQGFIKKVKTMEEYGADIKAKSKLPDEVNVPEPFVHTPELLEIPPLEPYLIESANSQEIAV